MNKHPHVVMILPSLRPDGAVGMMLTLGEQLQERGYRVDILVLKKRRGPALPTSVLHVCEIGAARPILAVPSVVRYLRTGRPHLILATEHYSGIPALLGKFIAASKARCVIRQDNTWSQDKRKYGRMGRLVLSQLMKRLFGNTEIIAVSNGVAEDFATEFPSLGNNIVTIFNPVVSNDTICKSKAAVNHPWLKDHDLPVVVAVGRLQRAKGFDVLVRAFRRVVDEVPARLLILGEGPERGSLEVDIRQMNMQACCQLLGYQANPYPFLANADLFVLSSRFEGLPTVLIEALSLGTQIVSTDCDSGPREILAGGRYGTLVKPGDVDSLATGIIGSLSGTASSEPAPAEWLEQFSVRRSVDQHIQLMELALSSPLPKRRNAPLDIQRYDAP